MVELRLPTGRVWAVWVLLALIVLMYLVTQGLSLYLSNEILCGFFGSPYDCALFVLGWKQNVLIAQGQYWRLLTATFLHSGLMHLAFNGIALYALGPDAERVYGTLRFLVIYFLAGLTGSVASYAFSPAPSVGASGSIFGMFGALAVFFYTTRGLLGEFGQRQLQSMVGLMVINLVLGFAPGSNIDNYGHIGGLLAGLITGWLLVPRYSIERIEFTPTVVRRTNPLGWVGIAALVAVLSMLVAVIRPPL